MQHGHICKAVLLCINQVQSVSRMQRDERMQKGQISLLGVVINGWSGSPEQKDITAMTSFQEQKLALNAQPSLI